MTFTPGPWTGWYTSSGSGIAWAIGPEGCKPCVAIVDDDPDGGLTDGATIEGNARLIAAAPEMLVLARQVMAFWNDPLVFGDEATVTSLAGKFAPLAYAAMMALAKAEGHPPPQGTPSAP